VPMNAEAERVNALKHVWTFGVATAALLHDIGKTISDQRVTLFGSSLPTNGRMWQPMVGSMAAQGAEAYQVQFIDSRTYEDHARLGVMLMQRIVPAHVLAWMGDKDPSLLKQILDVLSDSQCQNVIKEIVRKADSESTRLNLLSGSKSRFKTARETPLIDLLDQGLVRLLASGKLRLNVAGGHGFVWEDADGFGDLILVVPRVMDTLREHLQDALSEGARGIPSDNITLYGTLQDYGRIRPTEEGRSVWRVIVQGIPKSLTVLRFARGSVTFKALTHWPASFEGEIRAVTAAASSAECADTDEMDVAPSAHAGPIEQAPGAKGQATRQQHGVHAARMERPFWMDGDDDPQTLAETVAPRSISIASARAEEATAVEVVSASAGLMPPEDMPAPISSEGSQAASQKPKKAVPSMKDPNRKTTQKQENLEVFEDWLRIGLKSGHLRYNDGKSALHFHKEGDTTVALLISPALYQRYIKEKDPEQWSKVDAAQIPREVWVPLQSSLLKAHAHKMRVDGKIKRTVFKYATKGSGVFQCNVLTDPVSLFQHVPEPNPYISGEVSTGDLMQLFNKA
jgi:hypothetical protein